MLYGNPVHDPVCGRCKKPMHIAMLKEGVYQDGLWFHTACHREGADQLYRATRLANVLTAVEWDEVILSPHPNAVECEPVQAPS
jgi:hypothetical protein